MFTKHPKNEQMKRTYFHMLRHAEGKSEATIRQVSLALTRFERFTKSACFKTFDQRQAVAFKDHLGALDLSVATILSTIKSVKRFLGWLAMQPGYKSRIHLNDIEYLNLTDKTVRAATAARDVPHPTLAMVKTAISAMPHETDIEKRDRAFVAFAALTAIRVSAAISLKRKHYDARRELVSQNPREVDTKFSKRIDTFLFPIGGTFKAIFDDWIDHYDNTLLFGPEDPLFPATRMGQDNQRQFRAAGLKREHWKTSSPARKICKQAFCAANLPAYTPHSFRHMIVHEMYDRDL
jgi:integrase